MRSTEWKNFGKFVLIVCGFNLGQWLVSKLLAKMEIVFMFNSFRIDLTTPIHTAESVLVYAGVLYLVLKKYGYWQKLFPTRGRRKGS